MSSRRRFQSVRSEGVENAGALMQHAVIHRSATVQPVPMTDIQLDPENVREMLLNPHAPEDLDPMDLDYERKERMLESVRGLAASIKNGGLINPVEVYRRGDKFILHTGQRRYFAHLLLGEEFIRATVLLERPSQPRFQQYVENEQREDMSLYERIYGLESVFSEAGIQGESLEVRVEFMQTRLGVSRTVAYRTLRVLDSGPALREAIRRDRVRSMRRAEELSGLSDEAIEAALHDVPGAASEEHGGLEPNASTGDMGEGDGQSDGMETEGSRSAAASVRRVPRPPNQRIPLGRCEKPSALKIIMSKVMGDEVTQQVDWNDNKSIAKAWKKMLAELESQS